MTTTSQARPLSLARTLLVALVAYVLGAGTVLGAYLLSTRTTEVWVAKAQVTAGGIIIPAGTQLIHDSFMSEGFDVLCLYLNVDTPHDEQFTRVQDPRGRLVIPYWVGSSATPSAASLRTAVPNPGMQRTRCARP